MTRLMVSILTDSVLAWAVHCNGRQNRLAERLVVLLFTGTVPDLSKLSKKIQPLQLISVLVDSVWCCIAPSTANYRYIDLGLSQFQRDSPGLGAPSQDTR